MEAHGEASKEAQNDPHKGEVVMKRMLVLLVVFMLIYPVGWIFAESLEVLKLQKEKVELQIQLNRQTLKANIEEGRRLQREMPELQKKLMDLQRQIRDLEKPKEEVKKDDKKNAPE